MADYLYSEDNVRLDTQKFCYFDMGGCAKIYRNDDILLKIYMYNCKHRFYLTKKMFNYIKEADIPNMVKLLETYHIKKNMANKMLPMDAYTMEIVKGKKVILCDQKRDYLNHVISQLEETIEKLAEKKIILEDTSAQNIIFNENGVTIIDPDQFFKARLLSRKDLYNINKNKVIQYINRTIDIERESKKNNYISPDYGTPLTKDFNDFLEEETINESIQKKLYKSI